MGLLGVPLNRYSGMRPSPIVWGPRSYLYRLKIYVGMPRDCVVTDRFLPPIQ